MLGAVVIFEDISERKRLEAKLRDSEERFRALYTKTPALLHSIDADGTIIDVSDHWLETFGYSRQEVIGRKSVEFMTEASRRYAEAAALPEFWRTGVAHDVPYQFLTKSGEIRDILLSASGERDEGGNIFRTFAVLTDVTRQTRAEQELIFTGFAVDYMREAAFWMDSDAQFCYVNRAACLLVNYTQEELLTMTLHEVAPDFPGELWQEVWTASEERGSYTIKSRLRGKDGRVFPVEITFIYLESGRGKYSLSFVRDITERVQREEALRQAREELEGSVERQMVRRNPYRLTFRELTVLHHVAAGKSDKEIAAELGISPLTVQNHVGNILRKMNASSRTDASVRAVREGLLE